MKPRACLRSLAVCMIWVGLLLKAAGAEAADDRSLAIFREHVEPLLSQKCYKCHSHTAEKAKGGLVLDSEEGWRKGGEHGPAIVPGEPEKSLLWKALSYTDADLQMPPPKEGGKLPATELEHLRQWIELGASDPRKKVPAMASRPSLSKAREHWAFRPLRRPAIPSREGGGSAVDAFVNEKLRTGGLHLNPEAPRRVLIRRLYSDLIGLPPTPAEVQEFVADNNALAYERLVDRLLESPHYGERWGRHWLDAAGFSESSLFIGDQIRPGFWRYRDYVIRSFNSDKPYDRFLVEQLAGDELFDWRRVDEFSPEQIDLLAATGFLRCPPDATDNQPITQMEKRFAAQQNAVEVAMKAICGLSLNCVRCHSHKYDPIQHEEYYQLMGIFQPAYDPENWLAGIWSSGNPGPIRAIPILNRAKREAYEKEASCWPEERKRLAMQVNNGLQREWRDRHLKQLKTSTEAAALLAREASERSQADENILAAEAERLGITKEFLEQTYPQFKEELERAKARQEKLKKQTAEIPPVIWATFDVTTKPSPARLLTRGDFERPAQEVKAGLLALLDDPKHPFKLPDSGPFSGSTGRRLALARWLASPERALPARVMANRIWQYHFGGGLVNTPDDFGARGAAPSHPELLEWLASEFVSSGWSIKHIHRVILNSAAYKQTSAMRADGQAKDPADKLLWKFPLRRIEAEVIRDTLLELGGQLDHRLFGESIPTQKLPDGQFVVSTNNRGKLRRSVYLSTKRTATASFLAAFDAPSMDSNWSKRSDSVIPQQALAMMNNPFVLESASRLAERLLREAPDFTGRLKRAISLVYAREASREELDVFESFIGTSANDPAKWRTVCQALLSSNEFLYVD